MDFMEGTRLNALLQLTPFKVVEECCEFEWYLVQSTPYSGSSHQETHLVFRTGFWGGTHEKVEIRTYKLRREYVHQISRLIKLRERLVLNHNLYDTFHNALGRVVAVSSSAGIFAAKYVYKVI